MTLLRLTKKQLLCKAKWPLGDPGQGSLNIHTQIGSILITLSHYFAFAASKSLTSHDIQVKSHGIQVKSI